MAARILRSADGPGYRRERLETEDGDFLDLDWGPQPIPDAPIVVVLHGLEGSARRRYVRNVCRELLRHGIQPVALNFRGCSGEANKALHYYHSGKTDDPEFVLARLGERHPTRAIGALGFSLGGNVLIKLMGERADGGAGLLDAAAVMSVPYDLAAGCALLEQTRMGRAYMAYFLRSLKGKLRLKEARLREVVDFDDAMAARTLWEFDDRLTAPLNGFTSAADYYEQSSSLRFVEAVRVPTLLVHAEDDPFLPPSSIPVREAEGNGSTNLLLHARGGHVGFLEGTPWEPSFWADEESTRYLAERLRARSPDTRPGAPGSAAEVP